MRLVLLFLFAAACGGNSNHDSCACADGKVCNALQACVDPPKACGNDTCDPDEDCVLCNADCGDCTCETSCGDVGAKACSSDGFAYEACVVDPKAPGCTVERRVPCDDGRSCSSGACSGACTRPEIVLLLDDSSSMAGARWDAAVQGVREICEMLDGVADVYLRRFPGGEACGEASAIMPCKGAPMGQPSSMAETPIASAFEGLATVFGDPNEREAVILITDGQETCGTSTDVTNAVRALRTQRGIETYAIAVSQQADHALLHKISLEGGTADEAAGKPFASTREQLWTRLRSIYQRLEGCGCSAAQDGKTACHGDQVVTCSGGTLVPAQTPPNGWCGCTPGQTQCGSKFTCSARGQWEQLPAAMTCATEVEPNSDFLNGVTHTLTTLPLAITGRVMPGDKDYFHLQFPDTYWYIWKLHITTSGPVRTGLVYHGTTVVNGPAYDMIVDGHVNHGSNFLVFEAPGTEPVDYTVTFEEKL